ncbi:ATP-binding protein [Amycolatopsis samaneae]|uniref:LuxR family transcriptional regulator n=1 Tax=Amycolatopsis samaneae TaxID=664691 RepID=A0ABW5GUB0_9PSEU
MRAESSRALIGRQAEIRHLEALLGAARRGKGGVLVLRGEPGTGKSALLAYTRSAASGFLVLDGTGVECETELPFAALHRMCMPVLGRLGGLPGTHRAALEVAFGVAPGVPDPFRIGLAVLELLGGEARQRPLVGLVDDTHWLDDASARAMAFVARRIATVPVALVFAEYPSGPAQELPGLVLGGLGEAAARTLLSTAIRAPLDDRVRERVLAEARGNPLALLELPRTGGFEPPAASAVSRRIERGFLARAAELGPEVRLLLTLASAEPTGDAGLLWRAGHRLGITGAARNAAEGSGLIEIGTRVRFCHPVARSAIYRAAEAEWRHTAHRVLAEVTDPLTDPDRRAWHRAQAGTGPDEDVAAELERCASHARARGGMAATAAFLERAAALSLDPGRRTERTLAAARATLDAGATETAAELLGTVLAGTLDDHRRAEADRLRGRIAFTRKRDGEGPSLLLRAAGRLAGHEPERARDCLLEALEMGLVLGAGEVLDLVLATARVAPPPAHRPDMLAALVVLLTEGHRVATPLLRRVLTGHEGAEWVRRPTLAALLAVELWDLGTHDDVTQWLLKVGREDGVPAKVGLGLAHVAASAAHVGELDRAEAAIAEAEALDGVFCGTPWEYSRLHVSALRGRRKEALGLIEAAVAKARGEGRAIANANWAAAVLHNGLADYPAALAAARRATADGDLVFAGMALPELVEAAVRCGEPAEAGAALESLTERAEAGGTAWGLGVASYARALATGEEEHYRAAVGHLAEGTMIPYRGRAHLLYGEWLRRERRGRGAREHLRVAHELLSRAGMEAFAQRAAAELRATGEPPGSGSPRAGGPLTTQELRIARLVATGATSREVAGRLFLSPRTIDAHLRSIFRKLGITSRRQLRDLSGGVLGD